MRCDDEAKSIDWNRIWQLRKEMSRRSQKGIDSLRHWERREQAERYAHDVDRGYRTRIGETLSLLPVVPEVRVLDIGAGPGTLAIPLALRGAEVTAVEPAEGMADILQKKAREAGISSISLVPKRWEDVDPAIDLDPGYDLVVASFSLSMDDIRAAVEKMNAVASGGVYLFWFADEPLWEQMYGELWELLHGEPYCSGPKSDCLTNLLNQMGIRPHVLMAPLDKEYRFSDLNEAMAFFAPRFGVENARQESILLAYLMRVNQAKDGRFAVCRATLYASIWWDKKQAWPARFFSRDS
jgi:SAM-dependent methyltransferase